MAGADKRALHAGRWITCLMAASSLVGCADESGNGGPRVTPDGGALDGRVEAGPRDAGLPVNCPLEGAQQDCYEGSEDLIGVGACTQGRQRCERGAEFLQWGTCVGSVLPADETCGNRIDDDCDGATDETCPDAGMEPCVEDAGVPPSCPAAGVFLDSDPRFFSCGAGRYGLRP